MPRDPRAYLWDALHGTGPLREFSAGKSFTDYQADAMLRSAVERQFEIIGEALNRLAKVAPEIAAQVPDLRRMVAFRNILIHGYASVDDALVWQVLAEKRPELERSLRVLLGEPAQDSPAVTRRDDV